MDVDEDIHFNLRALVDGVPAAPGEVVMTTVEVGHADGKFNRKAHCFKWLGVLNGRGEHNVTMQWKPTEAPNTDPSATEIGIEERTLKIEYNKWGHNSCGEW